MVHRCDPNDIDAVPFERRPGIAAIASLPQSLNNVFRIDHRIPRPTRGVLSSRPMCLSAVAGEIKTDWPNSCFAPSYLIRVGVVRSRLSVLRLE
jgi:hypothetical protein